MVLEKLFEHLRPQNTNFRKKELALYQGRIGIIKNCPDWDKVIQLAAGLLDHTIQSAKDNRHP
ncbi:hypothetical protein ACKS0A_06693 [Histoplasma ohiense]